MATIIDIPNLNDKQVTALRDVMDIPRIVKFAEMLPPEVAKLRPKTLALIARVAEDFRNLRLDPDPVQT